MDALYILYISSISKILKIYNKDCNIEKLEENNNFEELKQVNSDNN